MKNILLVSLAFAALAVGPALAADMPVKAPPRPAPPVYSWTGCYGGTNVGGAWVNKELTDSFSLPGTVFNLGKEDDGGYVSGVQVGCDYQFSGIVIGARGMYDWTSIDFRHYFGPDGSGLYSDFRVRSYATAVGRLGVTTFDSRMLLYAVGGWAWTRDRVNVYFTSDNTALEFTKYSVDGWVVGGGFEFFLTPNLTFFAEYNHLDFGTKRVCFTSANTVPLVNPCAIGGGDAFDIKQRLDVVMFGFNYRLNWAAPAVAAKY